MAHEKHTEENVRKVAERYVELLREELEDDFHDMVGDVRVGRGNEHDYCDANMTQDQAFQDVLGETPEVDDWNGCEFWNAVSADAEQIIKAIRR